MTRININNIKKLKKLRKIKCLTAYTSSIAKIIDPYVDIILIGDSVGTAIYGMKNTRSVTLEMMKNHGKAVCKASSKAFTVIDMPYGTYNNKREALNNAKQLLASTKCQSVKLETNNNNVDIVKHLTQNKIVVVSHIGVTPQKYKDFSKIRSVGKSFNEQKKIYTLAKKLEEAESSLIVLECMKVKLANKISKELTIPTIGIGASANCDGQILVINDLLNTDNLIKKPRFVKSYTNLNTIITNAVKKYSLDIIKLRFPKKKNTY